MVARYATINGILVPVLRILISRIITHEKSNKHLVIHVLLVLARTQKKLITSGIPFSGCSISVFWIFQLTVYYSSHPTPPPASVVAYLYLQHNGDNRYTKLKAAGQGHQRRFVFLFTQYNHRIIHPKNSKSHSYCINFTNTDVRYQPLAF